MVNNTTHNAQKHHFDIFKNPKISQGRAHSAPPQTLSHCRGTGGEHPSYTPPCRFIVLYAVCIMGPTENFWPRPLQSSFCNPGTTSQSRNFGIGIFNPEIENPVKQPMATDQSERQRRNCRHHSSGGVKGHPDEGAAFLEGRGAETTRAESGDGVLGEVQAMLYSV